MASMIHKIANKTYTLKVQLAKSTDLSLGLKTIHCRSETIVMKTRADQGHIEMTTITGPFLKCAMNVNLCCCWKLFYKNLQRCCQTTVRRLHWIERNTKWNEDKKVLMKFSFLQIGWRGRSNFSWTRISRSTMEQVIR